MKKSIFAAIALISTTVFAGEYVGLDFAPNMIGKNDTPNYYQGGLTLGTEYKGFFAEGKVNFVRTKDSTDATDTGFQGAVGMNMGPFFVRGGVGEQYTTGSNFSYYTYGGGLKMPVFDNLKAIASVDNTKAFNESNDGKFTTWKVGGEFDLDKKNTAGVAFVKNTGTVESQGLQFNYGYKF